MTADSNECDLQRANAVREKTIALQRLLESKRAARGHAKKAGAAKATQPSAEQQESTPGAKASEDSQRVLSDFMCAAGEPITFVEAREIWNDLCSKNSGSFPRLQDAFLGLYRQSMRRISLGPKSMLETPLERGYKSSTSLSSSFKNYDDDVDVDGYDDDGYDSEASECDEEEGSGSGLVNVITEQKIGGLSDTEMQLFATHLATGIKDTYSIRRRDDTSEFYFITRSMCCLWIAVASIAAAGYYCPTNSMLGSFGDNKTLQAILIESFALFAIELVWECFLSWIVLRYDIKINYTRKLGNLLKVPKYFVAEYIFPGYSSTALSMTTALAINQTLFNSMYYRRSREAVPFFSYVFLSQDRREDRPDTLIFQVTEDLMRFAIYFPFKLLVADLIGNPAIIFIPIAVNNIGDGLAEPVGVAFGKHKYTTTALYHSKYREVQKLPGRVVARRHTHIHTHTYICTRAYTRSLTQTGFVFFCFFVLVSFSPTQQRANSFRANLRARGREALASFSPP